MAKNYLKKFIKYANNVYCIEDGLNALTDERKNPSYTPKWLGDIKTRKSVLHKIVAYANSCMIQ